VPIQLRLDRNEITSGIERAREALAPDVIRIRYAITPDWSGEEAIFFRVLLSDRVSTEKQLQEITQRIQIRVLNEVKVTDLGFPTYFNFRGESEQAQLKEASWE
jgi:hypothetical protein